MNFVHGVFYIAIFSNMAQRQRARYRVARYVIVNNVTTATLESKTKNAWKRHENVTDRREMETVWTAFIWVFRSPSVSDVPQTTGAWSLVLKCAKMLLIRKTH